MTRARARIGLADAATLGAVALAGLANLPIPFDTDQGFFATGARGLLEGGVLYRDFWDVKQPGIFWFYVVAARAAGLREIAIHAVELAYMLALATTLLVALRRLTGSARIARLAPVLTVGAYYAGVGANHLTQVEGLVGFPLFLSLWWAVSAADPGKEAPGRLFLSGIAGGVTLLFKLVLLPIPLAIWLVVLWDTELPDWSRAMARLARRGALVGLGAALPLLAGVGVLYLQGALGTAVWTFFVYTAQQVHGTSGIGVPDSLVAGLMWFGERFAPLVAFALVGAHAALGQGARPGRRATVAFARGLVVWVVVGAGVIALQRKWWPYHYLLLLVPLGILAAIGVDAVWRRATTRMEGPAPRWLAGGALALLFLGLIGALAYKVVLVPNGLGWRGAERRLNYMGRFNPAYPALVAETAFLRDPASQPGAIYVFGDPLRYYLGGRTQAAAFPGAWADGYDRDMWARVADELTRVRPRTSSSPTSRAPPSRSGDRTSSGCFPSGIGSSVAARPRRGTSSRRAAGEGSAVGCPSSRRPGFRSLAGPRAHSTPAISTRQTGPFRNIAPSNRTNAGRSPSASQ